MKTNSFGRDDPSLAAAVLYIYNIISIIFGSVALVDSVKNDDGDGVIGNHGYVVYNNINIYVYDVF